MSVTEVQVPLPPPPTGVALVIAEHEYNPESGHYEPPLRDVPRNANVVAAVAPGGQLIAGVTPAAPVWIYHLVFANAGAAEIVTLTRPDDGITYVVAVPANLTTVIVSTPQAPLFVSRGTGNIMAVGAAGNVTVTATYVVK